jgi:SAM-dependent methyltransferase
MLGGIPDFRVNLPHWIDVDADRRKASRLLELSDGMSAVELALEVFRARAGWTESAVRRRTRQSFDLSKRLERELDEWLLVPTSAPLPFLDLGCGSAPLLAAAASKGRNGIGIDVSLEWLVVARQHIRERGGAPMLAAALGESLPLGPGSCGGVVSLDVIEHVGDQCRYLREIDRVLTPGGSVALSTPNRYSLTAEPHISIWGVGWLPRAWQGRYVLWRTGKPYDYNRLVSVVELRRLVRRCSGLEPRILVAPVPQDEIAHFRKPKAFLARLYNWFLKSPTAHTMLVIVSPFFRVLARKGEG